MIKELTRTGIMDRAFLPNVPCVKSGFSITLRNDFAIIFGSGK